MDDPGGFGSAGTRGGRAHPDGADRLRPARRRGAIAARLGDGRGVEDRTFHLGRILNRKVGLDVRCDSHRLEHLGPLLRRPPRLRHRREPDDGPLRDPARPRAGRLRKAQPARLRRADIELRQLDPDVAISFLNETSGSAIIGRALRMEACSLIVARHTAFLLNPVMG